MSLHSESQFGIWTVCLMNRCSVVSSLPKFCLNLKFMSAVCCLYMKLGLFISVVSCCLLCAAVFCCLLVAVVFGHTCQVCFTFFGRNLNIDISLFSVT